MYKWILPVLMILTALVIVSASLGTGSTGVPADGPASTVLGEEDLAEQAEIWRNQYRRMTPGDVPLVQDVGELPAAWELFGNRWNSAPAERDLATWLVPFSAECQGGTTVIRDAAGGVLWSGTTDFAMPGSTNVTLTGALVDEADWPLYDAAREEIASRLPAGSLAPTGGGMRYLTNSLRFTNMWAETNGDYRLDFAWEEDGDVQVFCRAMHSTSWVETVVWTNDENEVLTNDFTRWRQLDTFNGRPDAWTLLGVATVTNGAGSFTDTTAVPDWDRVRFYAAAKLGDQDNDGITDGEEWLWGITSPTADTDNDGLADFQERKLYGTDPDNPDTDGDAWTDGEEVAAGTDPLNRLDATRLARGVLVHAVKYACDSSNQWVQLHCCGPRPVDVSGFRLQVAGTNWETVATLPGGTWMVPGHFLLVGDEGVTNADLTAELELAGAYYNLPTAGVRLMAPADSTNAPVDTVFYGRNNAFNEQGLETNGWSSYTTNLWASSTRHLERWSLGLDTDRENDWRHVADGDAVPYNADTILDSDGDDLTDEEEYKDGIDPLDPDTDDDGLLDGFEKAENLRPDLTDSDGDGTFDGDEIDPETQQPYEEKQRADGVTVATVGPTGWAPGGDLGLGGVVTYTLTNIGGFAVWGTVWEGGATDEDYLVTVSGADESWQWTLTPKYGHKTTLLFIVPDGTNAVTVTVTDNSAAAGVSDPDEQGADINVAFKAIRLDVEAGGVDEEHEENPGVFLFDKTVHTNAPRTMCRLSMLPVLPALTSLVPGALSLEWEPTAVLVYPFDQPTDGQPLTSLDVPIRGFVGTNVWLEGIAATNTAIAWKWETQTNGQDWVSATGVRLLLKEMDFYGVKCHTVKQDDGTVDYAPPHWQDNSSPADGDVDDTCDVKRPICFTRNTKMVASAYWVFYPYAPGWNIKIKGDGPGNLDFPATTAIQEEDVNLAYIEDVECENPFTNAVAYYPSMEIQWSFSIDDGVIWLNAGTSANQTYVTLGDPLITNIYHTLVHIGCANAAGQTTTGATADAIYSEFTDLEVRRVSDNVQMTYWANDDAGEQEPENMLKSLDGNGDCQAWSGLLRECFMVQGIPASRIWGRPLSIMEPTMLVKNWRFTDPPSGSGTYPYRLLVDATDIQGIPAQGNTNPPAAFNGHWITEACGSYFDPSYGTPQIGGSNKGKLYEDSSLDGYAETTYRWCRKNDTSELSESELKYEIDN